MKKIYLFLIFLPIFISGFYFLFSEDIYASPDWLSGWSYRKPVTIINSGNNSLSDYQVLVTLNTASLISAGKMRSDCGDIRFTDSDETTLLNYWIESGCNSASTRIWVKVPSIPTGSKTIYVYYGNPSANSASNARNTFDLFDDWESGTVDRSYWTTGGSVSPYWITYTTTKYQGNYSSGNNDIGDSQVSWIKKTISLSMSGILEFYWSVSSEANYDFLYYCIDNDACTRTSGYVSRISGEVAWTGVTYNLAAGTHSIKFAYEKNRSVSSGSDTGWIDFVKVRKYTSPEPTTSVGAEETPPPLTCAAHNVWGWAWSENVGWISFSCTNTMAIGTGVDYGVDVSTSTGVFSGYAWSDNIGWISFNRSETGSPPSNDPCPDGTCIAKLENVSQIGSSNVRVLGWARAISVCPSLPCNTNDNAGGWDGWIRFDFGSLDETYEPGEVYIDPNGNFHGYAWSDDPNVGPLGWISFNCQEGGSNGENICAISNYKVILNLAGINQQPQVTPDGVTWDNCTFKGVSVPTFYWTATDTDGSIEGYEIRIYGEGGNTFSVSSTIPSNGYTLGDINWIRNNLLFNHTYSWEIRVVDNEGTWSDWVSTTFSTPSHAYPYANFKWRPTKPSVGEEVQFCSISTGTCASIITQGEQSECYNLAGNVVPCSSFNWTFQNANPSSSNLENPTTTFTSLGSNQVILTIRDVNGYSCSVTTTVAITYPLPKWREIAPTSFLEKTFASLTNSFKFTKIYLTNFFGKLKSKL